MSKFSQLAGKIRILPEISSERERIMITKRVTQNAEEIADKLAIILRQAQYIDELTSSKLVNGTNDSISFATAQAKALKKLIQRDSFGSEKKISEHLENLQKKRQALETQRNKVWSIVQSEVSSVEIILGIAVTLKLDSVTILQSAVSNFKKVTTSPPSNKAEAQLVISSMEQNKTAIANSGLTGNVKKILEGAIDAKGDPRLLLEEDVQKFLKDHPELWGSLKLKLA